MEREILTLEKIKKDLKKQRKDLYTGFGVIFLFFPLMLWLFISSIKAGAVMPAILFSLYVLLWVGVLVWLAIDIVTRNRVLEDKKHIVIDEVTGVDEKALDRAVYIRTEDGYITTRFRYIIYFSDYGEYTTLDRAMYNSCRCNDKFYLVLSKPHTGKILLAYNAKRYVLEGEETKNSTER